MNNDPPTITTYILLTQDMKDTILDKDVGSILKVLKEKHGYRVKLILPKGSVSEIYAKKKGIEVEFIPRITDSNLKPIVLLRILFAVFHLIRNAKKIDVLQLYHPTYYSWILGGVYKVLNPQGVLYLKADSSLRIKEPFLTFALIMVSFFDIITIETEVSMKKAKEICKSKYIKHPRLKYTSSKLHFLPNGIFNSEINKRKIRTELIIIHGGRIGVFPKNSETVLDTMCKLFLKYPEIPAKLILIGNILSNKLKKMVFQCSRKYMGKIQYLGQVDRINMNKLYNRSSILFMPSRWESFGLMTIEAGAHGLALLLSDIPVFREITRNGKLGYLCPVEEADCYVQRILHMFQNKKEMRKKSTLIRKLVENKYTWENICAKLDKLIKVNIGSDYK